MEDSLDPELSVIELSPSFHDVWAEITQEINVRCTYVDSGNLPGPTSIALALPPRTPSGGALWQI